VSRRERVLLERFRETGSVEGLVEVRQLVKSARNERLPLLGSHGPNWVGVARVDTALELLLQAV
jgi:hypothetical protein